MTSDSMLKNCPNVSMKTLIFFSISDKNRISRLEVYVIHRVISRLQMKMIISNIIPTKAWKKNSPSNLKTVDLESIKYYAEIRQWHEELTEAKCCCCPVCKPSAVLFNTASPAHSSHVTRKRMHVRTNSTIRKRENNSHFKMACMKHYRILDHCTPPFSVILSMSIKQ